MKKKVLLGMSGGVDSSVAAILLQEQGYEVIGATMLLWDNKENTIIEDAKKVCYDLKIEHKVLDLRKEFKTCVISNFIASYEQAITPNPCIECNKHIKFKAFYNKALEFGCDYIATGHYAKTEFNEKYNQYVLKKSNSLYKDQTYVLYNIPKELLSKIIFPLGDFENKEDIRKIARDKNLNVASKPDSQEICFIPDNNYGEFLNKYSNKKILSGNIVNKSGKILRKA